MLDAMRKFDFSEHFVSWIETVYTFSKRTQMVVCHDSSTSPSGICNVCITLYTAIRTIIMPNRLTQFCYHLFNGLALMSLQPDTLHRTVFQYALFCWWVALFDFCAYITLDNEFPFDELMLV